MDSKEYIESGILELFVFGTLNEQENKEVQEMASQHQDIRDEIEAIEKAVINLSQSVAPHLSARNYEQIRQKLLEKHKVIQMKPTQSRAYLGWAASIVMLLGAGFMYFQMNSSKVELINKNKELENSVTVLEGKKKATESILDVIRDQNNTVVALAGQAVSPTSYAKAYYNKQTKEVYIDAAGLPEPPEGKVYQIWALKLQPVLTPTSIGLLENFTAEETRVFKVENADGAEAFGITLEPAGGSASPTMEQLYTLGKV
ncbi:anti-sigma factor [Flavobacterium sp.]|uniref:anti-sigma factor n=1 Tax=Flavobacterium sp. TaxID=239 RepID=UPI002B4B67A4|nr:anti-sigma factor [Flavobacterium sp.]HLP65432.1 anti-sigma factor [Flavobacterium sp.]